MTARVFGELPAATMLSDTPYGLRKTFLFILMVALWIGAGLIGRDPWSPQETGFVIFIAEKNGIITGLPESARPEMPASAYPTWAAVSAAAFSSWLPAHEGARMLNAILLALTLAFIWSAAGGGRRGWMAVLLTFGMTGLMVRAHLLNLAVPAFFGAAMLLQGASLLRTHALLGGIILGMSAAFLLATASPGVAPFALVGAAAVLLRSEWRRPRVFAGLLVAAVFFAPLAFLTLSAEHFTTLSPNNDWTRVSDFLRLAAWALFPTLPIAVTVLGHGRIDSTMFLCITMTAAAAVHFMLFGGREEDLFWLMPALAVFTARGLERLPDNYASILDWFAVIIVGVGCVGGMWVGWVLWQTGAGNDWTAIWRERFPLLGFPSEAAVGWKVMLALTVTVLWAGMAANFGRSNERAILNWSCGIAAAWCVFNLLWMPVVDSGKSYRGMAADVMIETDGGCMDASAAAGGAAAQLYYFGVNAGDSSCLWRLQAKSESPPEDFKSVWEGGRYDRKNYVLYRRKTETDYSAAVFNKDGGQSGNATKTALIEFGLARH